MKEQKVGQEKRIASYEGRYILLDGEGHLVNADDWSEGLAGHLGGLDGFVLAGNHWEVLRFVRGYYLRYQIVPMPKVIIKGLNKKHGEGQYTIKQLYALFSPAPMRRACRYAGIPQPTGCT